jgi:hypothetical protein
VEEFKAYMENPLLYLTQTKLDCERFNMPDNRNYPHNIVTCSDLCVTYKTGFGMDDSIYYTLYIHSLGLQVIQRYL